jgi:hypothetical protein
VPCTHIPSSRQLRDHSVVARVQLTASQLATAQTALTVFAQAMRSVGITDQEMAEWLLSLSVRWLRVHGVSPENIHAWSDLEMRESHSPLPLIAAARTRNDFGGRR